MFVHLECMVRKYFVDQCCRNEGFGLSRIVDEFVFKNSSSSDGKYLAV